MDINSTKESIRVTENDNVAKIEILNNCSLMVFFNEIKDKLSLEKFYHININNIFSGTDVFKKTIYIITNENKAYNLIFENTDNKNKISAITEKTIDKNEEDEVTINLLPNNNYSIKETKKDNNGVTKDIKLYEKRLTRDIPNFYKLSKNYALFIANDVLNNLKDIKDIEKIINIDDAFDHLNIISNSNFNKVASDNTISLSKRLMENDSQQEFDIILNKTMERVGIISFNNNKYDGNVNFEIYKEYQNKYFAQRALSLMKDYLKNNKNLIKEKI